jgi:hypothetical protein
MSGSEELPCVCGAVTLHDCDNEAVVAQAQQINKELVHLDYINIAQNLQNFEKKGKEHFAKRVDLITRVKKGLNKRFNLLPEDKRKKNNAID